MIQCILLFIVGMCAVYVASDFFRFFKMYLYRSLLLSRYAELLAILEYSRNTAYNKVYQDEILVYSSSGWKTNTEELKKFRDRYIKLVFEQCGPQITEDLVSLRGDMQSLCIELANWFTIRVFQDEATILSSKTGNSLISEDDVMAEKRGVMTNVK